MADTYAVDVTAAWLRGSVPAPPVGELWPHLAGCGEASVGEFWPHLGGSGSRAVGSGGYRSCRACSRGGHAPASPLVARRTGPGGQLAVAACCWARVCASR